MDNERIFNDIDGLVLAAISCQSNIDVGSWIGFMDYYYRIGLSYDEFSASLSKLQKSGILIYERGKLQCTERSKKLIADRNRMSVLKWIFKVQEEIVKVPFEESFEVLFNVSEEEYVKQLKKYHL